MSEGIYKHLMRGFMPWSLSIYANLSTKFALFDKCFYLCSHFIIIRYVLYQFWRFSWFHSHCQEGFNKRIFTKFHVCFPWLIKTQILYLLSKYLYNFYLNSLGGLNHVLKFMIMWHVSNYMSRCLLCPISLWFSWDC